MLPHYCYRIIVAIHVFFAPILTPVAAAWGQDKILTIYSTRQAFLLEPMLEAFREQTGINTRVLYAKNGLIERLVLEGSNTPADMFMSSNLVQLSALVDTGVTEAVDDAMINNNIAPRFRDQALHWFGLGLRARVIYINPARIAEGEIRDYLDLAKPAYRGRICSRPLLHPYNVGLVAYMLRSIGEERTQQWLVGLIDNLARDPQGNDRAQIRGVNAGECDIALANNYYLGVMKSDPAQVEHTQNVRTIFASLDGRFGTMSSVSGASMITYSDQKDEVIALIRFLSSSTAQQLYQELNHEMSVRADVANPDFPRLDQRDVQGNIALRGQAIALIEAVLAQ